MMLSLPSLSLLLLSSLSQKQVDPVQRKRRQQQLVIHPLKAAPTAAPKTPANRSDACNAAKLWIALDLDEIMNKISRHAGTRLGRMALLAGAGHHEKQRPAVSSSRFSSSTVPARQRRVTNNEIDTGYSREPVFNIKFSETADEARKEYSLVEEGMLLLGRDREIVNLPPI